MNPAPDETFRARERTWTLPVTHARVLVNGWQSWSEAELRSITDVQARPTLDVLVRQGHDVAWPPSGEAGVWRSHALIAVVDDEGRGWVGCSTDESRGFTRWEARTEDGAVRLTYSWEGEGDGEARLAFSDDPVTLVEELAATMGERMHARTPAPLRVWCSWYSYYRNVTLPDMLDNAHRARDRDLPFDVFQLDDGFQAFIGDWLEPSAHFKGHARDLPARLTELGFTAGLWLAPFIARPESELYRAHPDWFIQDEAGGPVNCGDNWGGPYYGLDATREDVQAWLEHLARTVTREWGYRYLKLDFLFAGAMPGRRARDVSRAEAYRMGLAALRRGAGDDTFILGCGAPLAASVGLVDAMRTGPDVAPLWDDYARRLWLHDSTGPAARNAVVTSLARWYQHRWYQPDPDVMIARRELSLLNDDERGALLGLLDVVGGLRASSDPLHMLGTADLDLLRASLRVTTPDRPVDLRGHGDVTVTRFTRGRFNMSDLPMDGVPAHAFTGEG